MKNTVIILVILCLLLSLTSCTDKNSIYFNYAEEYIKSERGLVESVIVTQTDFRSKYDVDFTHLVESTKYDITYQLEYCLDAETLKTDLSQLYGGIVTISHNDKVIFVVRISKGSPIVSYVVDRTNVEESEINGCRVILFDLSGDNSSLLYGEFKSGDYYVICSMYEKNRTDMVRFIKTIM